MTTTSDQATPSRRRRREEPPGHDKAPGRTRGRPRGKRHGGRAARRRKRGPLRTVLMAVLALAVLGTGGLGWVYLKLNGDIDTFDGEGLSKNRPESGTSKGANVLVIGSDARTEGNSALGGGSKDDIGRADTAFLLHVYADHKHAIAVSIPRDTLVTIPPCLLPDGTWTEAQSDTMFNAAFSVGQTESGNPACTQNTVEELTGLRVDHTLVVDFKGFAALTDVVGGVRVCLPQDIYQGDLNPNRATKGDLIFEKGEQDVSGQKALDYVRIRHGIGDGSDIGRIKRQQAFVSSLLKKIKSDGLTPTKLLPLATAATQSMTVDPGLGTADKLIAFGMSLKDIDLHDTKFVTVPWRYQGSRVALAEPDASGLWAALKADRTIDGKDASGGSGKTSEASASPGATGSDGSGVDGDGIDVAVYNGTTVEGLAAEAATALTGHGFTVTGTGNAGSREHSTTVVQYGTGQRSRAETVAELFPGAQLEPIGGSAINVVVGASYTAGDSPAAPGAGTETTPTSASSSVAEDARSGDDDLCADLSYGTGG
ncbi:MULTISPECIES: LCP family protein [unclassified Streptomyces]|uniref:LCP family protein n=1 Tax=unclassified Streptomyces TaxID=2593676 RepID=UPI000CD5796D|nr:MULTISPECIES: LCP family protein [unclassified Streptomyces]AWL39252.1 LytR family transcriptional regulator [Streptomyces sp. SM18]